jgi:hypothetical protein
MSKLQDTEIKCHACGGAGYTLHIPAKVGETIQRKCSICDGTGLSNYGRAMEEIPKIMEKIGICPKCDRPMVHYRKRGYVCRYCEE